MKRESFCVAAAAAYLLFFNMFGNLYGQSSNSQIPLIGNRFVTFSIVIRTTPWEVSRDVKILNEDEYEFHTLQVVRDLRETFAKACPEGTITWGFSLNALEDTRPHYAQIRNYVVECHNKYGDEITYFPCHFSAMYLPRERVNREMTEAIQIISDMVGNGYRPKSILGGFLSAENLRYLSEKENIHVAHGNIWSQHSVDAGGTSADGAICYPYYPSKEHICKPAQNQNDFIDCVNLDGYSVDFLNAMVSGGLAGTTPYNGLSSRRGVGPIETYCEWGLDIGHQAVMHTQSIHFDRGFELNGFGYVPVIWEAALLKRPERIYSGYELLLNALNKWISDTKAQWKDVKFISFGEFGEIWRGYYKDNSEINYRFEEKGLGIGNSWGDEEIRWFMNKEFRLALMRNWHKNTPLKVVDFTRYDLTVKEPEDPSPENPILDWSLMNRINQKGLRPQDTPVLLSELCAEDKQLIAKYYPELLK